MFIQGIRSRRPVPVLRFALPVLAGAALLVMVMLGQGALPGQTLYPVKEALASVGLAPSAVEDIDRRIEAARDYISEAEDILAVDAREARSHALEAIADLDRAR